MIIYADDASWSIILGMCDFQFDHRNLSYNLFGFSENDDSRGVNITADKRWWYGVILPPKHSDRKEKIVIDSIIYL